MADPDPFWHPAQVTERRIRLRWLTLWRWRAVQPGTRLDFADGINLILGRNGTGKTHLLDLLSVVLRGDLRPLQGEEFDLEWEIEVEGRWRLHLRARHSPSRRRGEAAESDLEHQVERPKWGGGPLAGDQTRVDSSRRRRGRTFLVKSCSMNNRGALYAEQTTHRDSYATGI
jgi:energy-coupling factor transporter ATP-binding protein EcfA2